MPNTITNEVSSPMHYKRKVLDGFRLKMIGFVFTLIDHIGLIFALNIGDTAYTILRDMGRLAMPIFIFLAIEGVYYTRDYWMYFIRLMTMGFLLDCVAFTMHYGFNFQNISPGNIFTDLAFGTMTVYLLKKKNWKSLLAIFPITLSIIACFSTFNNIPDGFQNVINFDYNFYGQALFIGFFIGYEGAFYFLKSQAKKNNLDEKTYMENGKLRFYINLFSVLMMVVVGVIFQLIWDYNPINPIIPSLDLGGMACESWSMLAGIFILLYDGRQGIKNKWARYSMYAFYPGHLLLLWLISLAL